MIVARAGIDNECPVKWRKLNWQVYHVSGVGARAIVGDARELNCLSRWLWMDVWMDGWMASEAGRSCRQWARGRMALPGCFGLHSTSASGGMVDEHDDVIGSELAALGKAHGRVLCVHAPAGQGNPTVAAILTIQVSRTTSGAPAEWLGGCGWRRSLPKLNGPDREAGCDAQLLIMGIHFSCHGCMEMCAMRRKRGVPWRPHRTSKAKKENGTRPVL